MMLKHRLLLTGLTILSIAVSVGGASARSAQSSPKHHHHRVQLRQPLYSYSPVAPVVPVARSGCYLPSDGCPNEYSVQN
jgi:hypothetical protein